MYFNYEKCCKQPKESKCFTRKKKAFNFFFLRKHFFSLSELLKPCAPQGQGPRWPFPARAECNSNNKIVLNCPEIVLLH